MFGSLSDIETVEVHTANSRVGLAVGPSVGIEVVGDPDASGAAVGQTVGGGVGKQSGGVSVPFSQVYSTVLLLN